MKVKLKEDLMYSKLTDLVCMTGDRDVSDDDFLFDVINAFMNHGHILHHGNDLELYITAGDIIELKQPTYSGPDYICNYHGIMLDFTTNGKLEVII